MSETMRVLLVQNSAEYGNLLRDIVCHHAVLGARNGWTDYDSADVISVKDCHDTLANQDEMDDISECRIWLDGDPDIVMMLLLRYSE